MAGEPGTMSPVIETGRFSFGGTRTLLLRRGTVQYNILKGRQDVVGGGKVRSVSGYKPTGNNLSKKGNY